MFLGAIIGLVGEIWVGMGFSLFGMTQIAAGTYMGYLVYDIFFTKPTQAELAISRMTEMGLVDDLGEKEPRIKPQPEAQSKKKQ